MTYTVITSMNKEYYDLIGNVFVSSFCDTWESKLIIYTEDDLDFDNPNIEIRSSLNNTNLKEYLKYIGNHRSRGFAFKVFAWIDAARSCDTEWLLWLDADSCCIRKPDNKLFESLFPKNYICSYMKTVMYKDKNGWKDKHNCDSAIISFNTKTEYSNRFVNEFERLYTSRDIDNRKLFPKPNDTHAFVKCIEDAKKQGYNSFNLNSNMESLSPIKETILGDYFRHFKASRKDKDKIEGVINKLISSTNKLKHKPNALAKRIERIERRFRNNG